VGVGRTSAHLPHFSRCTLAHVGKSRSSPHFICFALFTLLHIARVAMTFILLQFTKIRECSGAPCACSRVGDDINCSFPSAAGGDGKPKEMSGGDGKPMTVSIPGYFNRLA
jgi:hypothetical protein